MILSRQNRFIETNTLGFMSSLILILASGLTPISFLLKSILMLLSGCILAWYFLQRRMDEGDRLVLVSFIFLIIYNYVFSIGSITSILNVLLTILLFFAGKRIRGFPSHRIFYLYIMIILAVGYYLNLFVKDQYGNFGRDVYDNSSSIGLANIYSIVVIYSFSLLKVTDRRVLLHLALFAGAILLVILTGSRGTLLSVLLALAFCHGIKIRNTLNVLLILSVLGILLKILPLPEVISIKVAATTDRFYDLIDINSDKSSQERLYVYKVFFNDFVTDFFGKKNWKGITYPHNLFVELYWRFGVLLTLGIIFSVSRKVVRNSRIVTQNNIFFRALFIFSFLQSLTSLHLEINRALWLSLGHFYASYNKY